MSGNCAGALTHILADPALSNILAIDIVPGAHAWPKPAPDPMVESTTCPRREGGVSATSQNWMESRIERLCVEHGLKMTGQRRVIARILSDASDHPDVEELYRRATALDARISVATVYRTVRLLEEKGILERRDFGGGRARYEASEHGHHHHLIDVETGRVVEFEDTAYEEAIKAVAARLGFDVVSHRLELFGRRRDKTAVERRARNAAEAATDTVPSSCDGGTSGNMVR